jgi:hypothetical protein
MLDAACCGRDGRLTISATLVASRSAVIAMLCTRNLSRHLKSAGGSLFIACRRTVAGRQQLWGRDGMERRALDFDLLASLDTPGVRAHAVPVLLLEESPFVCRRAVDILLGSRRLDLFMTRGGQR